MKEGNFRMNPTKKTARIAGLLFLLMVVSGLFAELFFRQKVLTADAATTAANLLANMFLARAGIVSDIVMALSYLLTAVALYRLLRSVGEDQARLMVLFAAAGSILLLMSVVGEYMALLITDAQSGAFTGAQLGELAFFSFGAYENGYMVGQVFFALWVFPLGILICRSKFIPKVFGILFIIETVSALISVVVYFLFAAEQISTILLLPGTVAEFSFLFWLLIRGVNEKKLPAAA